MENKGRKVMCKICKEKFYKDELIQINKHKRICQNCNETEQVIINQRRDLIEFVCKLHSNKVPTGFQLQNIKRFKEMGYSYFEIHYTLYYIYVVLNKTIKGDSLGLVPYYYEKAKEHYQHFENARKTITNKTEKQTQDKKSNTFKANFKNTRFINIQELM